MNKQQLKDAIRHSRPTPDVPQDVFEAALTECILEDHPGSDIRTLQESRSSSSDGLPEGIHDRVARMMDASKARRQQIRQIEESRSDVRSDRKDDSLFDPPARDPITIKQILADAAARYKGRTDPAAIQTRAANLDKTSYARPTPFSLRDARTLQEAQREAEALPEHLHAVVAARLGGGR